MKARIGVTSIRSYEGPRPVEQVNLVYCEAVARAGAIPFVLPVLDPSDAGAVAASLDGLLLTGGGDVAAWCYGQEAVPEAGGMDAPRDAWELALVEAAGGAGLPMLGICRGAQLLNVSAGGTLLQHLPALSDELHRVAAHDREPVHAVVIEPASRLADITGGGPIGVNSLHHQAVDRVGAGLRAVAWSPEGFVEAIEAVDAPQVGVQWHPELLTGRGPHARLFAWLVAAALERRDHAGEELLEAVA
jgi:putative glutamine amidotransferase